MGLGREIEIKFGIIAQTLCSIREDAELPTLPESSPAAVREGAVIPGADKVRRFPICDRLSCRGRMTGSVMPARRGRGRKVGIGR